MDLVYSETNEKRPLGLIESFRSLLDEHKKQYQHSISKLQKNTTALSDIKKLRSVSLNKDFIKTLLIHTKNKYLKFAENDECKLLSLIDTGLARTAKGKIFFIPVLIDFEDGKKKNILVTKQDYLNYTYSKKCLNNREMLRLFTPKNIATTIKSLRVDTPKNKKECSKIHNEWTKNPFLPYLCAVSESIKKSTAAKASLNNKNYNLNQIKAIESQYIKGEFFNKKITLFHKEYFSFLCSHLYEPENFCAPYLAKDVWNKIKQKEQPSYKITYKCKHIVKKDRLATKDIEYCAKKFNQDVKICTTSRNESFGALYPMPNCNIISESLLNSSLYTDYHDCPGNIDNHAVINIHRIIAHKKKLPILSDELSCSSQAHYSLAQLPYSWPLKICYFDKISDKRECIPYVPKYTQEKDPLSEGHIVAKILYRIAGTLNQEPCTIISSKSFNPLLLKYKHGCFIVYDSQLCTTLHCKKKIIYDLKEIKNIEYTGANVFDYFPNSFKNEKLSLDNIILDSLKMEKKIIRNFTFLKGFFQKYSNAIVHGIGCAEDLLPSFFQKSSLGECSPLPFIVDGIVIKKHSLYLSFRSSIDDVHSPRLIPWDKIFNSISNYKELHPLNTWTLYGIK